MKQIFHKKYVDKSPKIDEIISSFDTEGDLIYAGDRNQIKTFSLDDLTITIKSFKSPNIINKIVYRFFRKSKAERSFEHAKILLANDLGTPHPIAYYEFPTALFFKRSYYVSEHVPYDLTFRELTHDLDMPEHEMILRAFTRFTHQLHKNNINFLDHSPGNTLIKKQNDGYQFYLVDLNRMVFHSMDFETRVKNLSRLTVHKSMIETMSDEYSKCTGEDVDKIFDLMWRSTLKFQYKFHRKRRIKNALQFWK
ncbi:MAG: Kdo domain containing protein [Flavobacteriaceae bacterium]|nr:Kdo domain containing protein [Flavobacteriaceae bacterium]